MPDQPGSTKVDLPNGTTGVEPRVITGGGGDHVEGGLSSALSVSKGCSRLRFGSAGDKGQSALQRSSGSQLLDGMLSQESGRLANMFLVSPAVAWFNDSGSGNAYATPETRLGRADGTIAMGIHLSTSIVRKYGSSLGPYATWIAMGVLAHEFGHIAQFKRVEAQGLRHTYKYPELHADFLAGAYLAQRALEAYQYNGTNLLPVLNLAMQQFFSIGDTAFNSPDHHGTGPERANAYQAGVRLQQQVMQSGGSIAFEDVFQRARAAAGY